jgi:hypothetical protein
MKKTFFLFLLLTILCFTQKTYGQTALVNSSKSFTLFEQKNFIVDLKFIDPLKGSFGIDYKLDLAKKITTFTEDTLHGINLGLLSKGFITVAGDKNQTNSIINELKIEAFPLFYFQPDTSNLPKKNWEDVVDSPDLEREAAQLASQVNSPLWIFLNVHSKHETTQDFKNYDFAFGGQLSLSTAILHGILDFPFGLLRVDPNNNPRQLDLSFGYDYVIGINNTALAPLRDNKDDMNRLNFKAEWETGIFTSRERIMFLLDAYHDLDATQKIIDISKDWTYFYMIKLDHLLFSNEESKTLTKVSIKYTQGALPPNFDQGFVLGGGFSVEF